MQPAVSLLIGPSDSFVWEMFRFIRKLTAVDGIV